MARNAVEDQNVAGLKAGAVEIQGDDLSGEGKMFIFEEEALMKDTLDKGEFIGRIGARRRIGTLSYGAELRSEI